jgi:hypothetical protein
MSKELKKVKLNFKIDNPTVNGRVYPKEVLKKAIDERIEDHLFVTDTYSNPVQVSDIIGECKDYEINEKGEITFHIHPIGKNKIDFDNITLSTSGFASLDRDQVTIKDDYKLLSLFVVNDDE